MATRSKEAVRERNDDDDNVSCSSSDSAYDEERPPRDESDSKEEVTNRSTSNESSSLKLGRTESEAVQNSKYLVYLVLALFAIGSASATWFFVRSEEQNEFEAKVSQEHTCIACTYILNIANKSSVISFPFRTL